jgi:hypothetical protein
MEQALNCALKMSRRVISRARGSKRRKGAAPGVDILVNATGAIFIGEMPRYLLAQAPSPAEKDHLIGTLFIVPLGKFDGITRVTQVDKMCALHNSSVF